MGHLVNLGVHLKISIDSKLLYDAPVFNRIVSIFGVYAFLVSAIAYIYTIFSVGEFNYWAIFIGSVLGWLMSDFATGTVHWFGDRFFHEDTPVVGSLLIFPFREHHVLPKKMTEHDFYELCGTSGLLVSIFWGITYWARGPQSDGLSFFFFFLGIFGFLTNLFHRWAHEENLGPVLRFLQKTGFILNPVTHDVHHRTYDKYYCVTNGHMNWILDKLRFFPTAEKLLFFLPQVDDDHQKSPEALKVES